MTQRRKAFGKWVATVYLSNGVITTVFLPSGFYRIAMAAGVNWRGEARLFGTGTSAWEWTSAVSVAPKVKPVIGSPTDATENAVPLASDASAPDEGSQQASVIKLPKSFFLIASSEHSPPAIDGFVFDARFLKREMVGRRAGAPVIIEGNHRAS